MIWLSVSLTVHLSLKTWVFFSYRLPFNSDWKKNSFLLLHFSICFPTTESIPPIIIMLWFHWSFKNSCSNCGFFLGAAHKHFSNWLHLNERISKGIFTLSDLNFSTDALKPLAFFVLHPDIFFKIFSHLSCSLLNHKNNVICIWNSNKSLLAYFSSFPDTRNTIAFLSRWCIFGISADLLPIENIVVRHI